MDWLQNTLVPGCANGVTCEYSTASEQSVEGRDIPIVTASSNITIFKKINKHPCPRVLSKRVPKQTTKKNNSVFVIQIRI